MHFKKPMLFSCHLYYTDFSRWVDFKCKLQQNLFSNHLQDLDRRLSNIYKHHSRSSAKTHFTLLLFPIPSNAFPKRHGQCHSPPSESRRDVDRSNRLLIIHCIAILLQTYDECIAKNLPECTSPEPNGYWTLVPYFCGHDPVCR
jgi:hypothetical protein